MEFPSKPIDYQTYLLCVEALAAQLPHVDAEKAEQINTALEMLREAFDSETINE